ncbi:hypothetical protein K503DRAFT_236470 [Rhizopogon vinicolor AM-OR11-026]|uniref:Uncharacterized protein n=1 Tax=Rhizopogon vinicolor AM-OR11-026 TaxID=1314800 RepID=A0A1B7MXT3_9AGAM|nr:hypothetical protein K503DRAFT_236470 [Rhizopogon vinicolor AM-OR11-026]
MNICSLLKSFGKYNYILRHLALHATTGETLRPSKKAKAGVKSPGPYAIKKSLRRSFVRVKENVSRAVTATCLKQINSLSSRLVTQCHLG